MMKTCLSIFPPTLWNKPGLITWDTVIVAIVVALALLLVQALLVMIFWNLTIPKIFHKVPCISFWQALGLVLLIAFLF